MKKLYYIEDNHIALVQAECKRLMRELGHSDEEIAAFGEPLPEKKDKRSQLEKIREHHQRKVIDRYNQLVQEAKAQAKLYGFTNETNSETGAFIDGYTARASESEPEIDRHLTIQRGTND